MAASNQEWMIVGDKDKAIPLLMCARASSWVTLWAILEWICSAPSPRNRQPRSNGKSSHSSTVRQRHEFITTRVDDSSTRVSNNCRGRMEFAGIGISCWIGRITAWLYLLEKAGANIRSNGFRRNTGFIHRAIGQKNDRNWKRGFERLNVYYLLSIISH